jgi:actin-related protein 5
MAVYSRTEEFRSGKYAVTKPEYDEFGGERVKRWWGGNWNGEFSINATREAHGMDVDI